MRFTVRRISPVACFALRIYHDAEWAKVKIKPIISQNILLILKIRHKIIRRLSEMKAGNRFENCDFRLIAEVVIHSGADISAFVNIVC